VVTVLAPYITRCICTEEHFKGVELASCLQQLVSLLARKRLCYEDNMQQGYPMSRYPYVTYGYLKRLPTDLEVLVYVTYGYLDSVLMGST